jgi:uncharacterized RDD family membrane protein YckC
MFCAKCGKELPAGATFCPSCGAPVGAATPGAAPYETAQSQGPPVSGFDALTKDSKAQSYWAYRLVALIIDALIVFVPLAIITVIVAVFVALGGPFGFTPFGIIFGGVVSILWYLLFILYNMVAESTWGAGFGKRFMHLKVISKSGSNPTMGEAFVRNISKIYWLILLLDVIVGLAVSKDYHQKYSDKLMGTSVVQA